MAINKKNIIDGLPSSYDHNYVLKTNKVCLFCQKRIKSNELENNMIICTEDFDFLHKECISKNSYEIIHSNPKDFTSMIKLKKIPNLQYNSENIDILL